MRWQEWLDKENGTDYALRGPRMSDTDLNIMRDLAGEADEPCHFCGEMVRPSGHPDRPHWEHAIQEDGSIHWGVYGQEPVCDECEADPEEAARYAKEAAEEARAEEILEARWADQEADFNRKWPV